MPDAGYRRAGVTARRRTLRDEPRSERKGVPERDPVYQRQVAKLQLAAQIARLRLAAGMSQSELARRIGTQQAGVARMERSSYQGHTVGTLAKIAAATGARLEVRLVRGPKHRNGGRG